MIVEEVTKIIEGTEDDGTALNELVDQFRVGRDARELLSLLSSRNDEIVSIGAWFFGELHFDLYRDEVFLKELFRLLEHKDPSVRFNALGAVYPALDCGDPDSIALLTRLKSDENEGVRRAALAAASNLGI